METLSIPPSPRPPARRILAIWCARLALDRWRQAVASAARGAPQGDGPEAAPLVLIGETAHGPQIQAASDAALMAGVAPGMLLADARSLCPQVQAYPADPAGDLAFLERFAVWAQRWGPCSAMDPPDGVLVDASAVAHLFGGERRMLADVAQRCAARGLLVRVALAPTAGAAWALAHHGPECAILGPDEDARSCLAPLPVAALRLDAEVLLALHRLGLKRIADLLRLIQGTPADAQEAGRGNAAARAGSCPPASSSRNGRDALQRRFRKSRAPLANPLLRLDQMLGLVPEPMQPVAAPSLALVQRRVLEPLRHREPLVHVLKDLVDDLVRLLEARAQGARRLELGLWRVDGEVLLRPLELAAASRDAGHIWRLLAGRLDTIDAGFGIELLRLGAPWVQPLALAQAELDAAAEEHGTALAACLDRLGARLGPQAITRPVLRASHWPERAQGWQPAPAPEPTLPQALCFQARPVKLLEPAERIAVLYASPDCQPRRFRWRGTVHEVVRVEGPERIAPEWWRERAGARLRDYYRVEDEAGRRYWIYRAGLAGDGRGAMPEWFLQGMFA